MELKVGELFADLNEAQAAAVKATEGPVLIFAGAGSGKTKCLTHRLAYILESKLATKDEILAITFTNKAAQELGGRILKLLGMPTSDFEKNPILAMRRNLPWVGTFHSICVRILRAEADNIGLKTSFTIFDSDDSQSLIRDIVKGLNYDPKQYQPRAIASVISNAKNEMLLPEQFAKFAQGHFQTIALEVYRKYQRRLSELSALDFDDLILTTVKMLEEYSDIREKYHQKFKYVMVDEYQDTNNSQYRLTSLLVNPKTRNLCVVGDDFQCLLPSTGVQTVDGNKKIEDIKQNDRVVTAAGFNETTPSSVEETTTRTHSGTIVEVKTVAGRKLRLTPEHICFARLQKQENQWFVYLMYRADKGYRIGITKGIRTTKNAETNGLMVRANQERADKMWIILTVDSLSEARYWEELLSIKYRLPKVVFFVTGRESMHIEQKHIDRLYREIDTAASAQELMADYLLFEKYPHFRPQGVTAEMSEYYPGRCQAYLVLFGDSRIGTKLPWHAHRVRLTTSNKQILASLESNNIGLRADKLSQRHETSRKHFADAWSLTHHLAKSGNIDVAYQARLTDGHNFLWQPASHLRPGMVVPVIEQGKVTEDEIASVSFVDYKGKIYDINVANTHNFAANGIVVHNSIYGWRGANFQNILNFQRDYHGTQVFKLEQNYRSTKTILLGAAQIIDRVRRKSEKKLWTSNEDGPPITIFEANNAYAEADFIATEIRTLTSLGGKGNALAGSKADSQSRGYSAKDFAILYRTNAQSRVLEEILLAEGIPYRLIGAVRFYERKEIKDMLSYLRLLRNPDDLYSLQRAVNLPPRGIGPKTLETGGPKLDKFYAEMATLRQLTANQSPSQTLETISKAIKYQQYVDDGTPEGEGRWENVEELINLATEFEILDDFLEHVALVSDVDNYNRDADAVTLMTLHSSKGLEFTTVFLTGLEEGLFPHLRSLDDESEMDEERRLCYVGITRAKKRLYLTHARSRIIHGGLTSTLPSRFLREFDESIVDRV